MPLRDSDAPFLPLFKGEWPKAEGVFCISNRTFVLQGSIAASLDARHPSTLRQAQGDKKTVIASDRRERGNPDRHAGTRLTGIRLLAMTSRRIRCDRSVRCDRCEERVSATRQSLLVRGYSSGHPEPKCMH